MSTFLSCLHWPTPRTTPFSIAPATKPTLVVGSAIDPNVTFAGVQEAAASLGPSVHLVQYEGAGHISFSRSDCIGGVESSFLVDPATWTPPPDGVCPAE